MSALTLRVLNFRSVPKLDWTPEGVCVLAGPNGSGKSSTLGALKFLRNAVLRGMQEATRFAEAGSAFRTLTSAWGDDVVFEVEWEGWRWRLGIPIEGRGVHAYNTEQLWRGDELVLDVPRLQPTYDLAADGTKRGRTGAEINTLQTVRPDPSLARFIENLKALRVYDDFSLFQAHTNGEAEDHVFLHPSGKNLVPVLNNWKRAPRRFNGQFEWVLAWTRRAFPDLIEDLEFTPDGQARFYPPGAPSPDASLPLSVAASGLMTGLLQLTAVAGAKPGSTIAFDEMENQLHPHAIRTLIAAMRERSDAHGVTVVLTTHSPVVLNQFRDEPEQVFVLGHGVAGLPVPAPMTALHNEEWLAQAKLGSLYERLAFGAPPVVGSTIGRSIRAPASPVALPSYRN